MTQRKPKFNIFWKTFLITTAMLLGITFIAFTLIYMLLPSFYQNHVIASYRQRINTQIPALEQAESLEDEIILLGEVFRYGRSPFSLTDAHGMVLFQLETVNSSQIFQNFEADGSSFQQNSITHVTPNFSLEEVALEWNLEVEGDDEIGIRFIDGEDGTSIRSFFNFSATDFDFNHTFLNLTFDYTTALNEQRMLEVSIPLSPLADAQVVIMSMYPLAILLSIIFALITAFIFSHWIANPIKKIQVATSKMSRLEPNVSIPSKSLDEIGLLTHDISQLYNQLHGTITTLEQEVSRYSDAENKKIEFLQSVSHEMKTPLASANALLEGIIYEVSPYHDNQKKYLAECRQFLQKTIQLTKESLNLSEQYKKPEDLYNLAEIIKETSNLYGVIFMVKQLSYHEDIPENISIRTKKHLLSKVLSNLFSNAANYTTEGGQVCVSFNDNVLTIFNSCTPLTQEQVDEIFKPLMTQNMNEHSTGLGLFIVKQLLR